MEETDDPVDAGKFANRVCNEFGSGAGNPRTRNVRNQGGIDADAATNSFMAKCKREGCQPKAVGSDGKPLRGANAKNSFMAKCMREQG